jgi:predicted CxxxxCH...CXXCH cytochrome family protein
MNRKNILKGSRERNVMTRAGIVVLSSLVVLLLTMSSAIAQQCGCDGCHGNPPTTNDRGGPTGLVGLGLGLGTSSGAHDHFTKIKQNLTCDACHFGGMPASPIPDFKLQIGFNINGGSGTGMTYDGSTSFLDPKWSYEATNGTTLTQNGTMKCSNVYCHGGGTGGTNNTGGISKSATLNKVNDPRLVAQSTSPAWYNVTPIGCNFCHGVGTTDGRPSYPSGNPKANSHVQHQDVTCNVCHYLTTHDNATIYIDPIKGLKHHNGVYDVVPDPTASTALGPVNFTYTFDPGGGRCTNVSCHGGTTGVWGSTTLAGQKIAPGIYVSSGSTCFSIVANAVSVSGGTPPYMYEWDFGDGNLVSGVISTLPSSTPHSYAKAGTYPVNLSVRDANYYVGEALTSASVSASNVAPVANGTIAVSGYVATVTDLSYDTDYNGCGHSGPGTINITWGDGTVTNQAINLTDKPSNQAVPHTYSAAPSYGIYLCITDNAGKKTCKNLGYPNVPG